MKFTGTCRCNVKVTSTKTGSGWRHAAAPADGHQASPVGVVYQV
jgi:hypothetical protein